MGTKISERVSIDKNFYNFLKIILKFWFKKQFRLEANIPDEVQNLKVPFLILPNHQGFWDPFMVGVYFKHPIYYITSDAVFRYPILDFFMRLLGAIPKQKAQSDLGSIKNIMKIRDSGGIIGIFPEGRRTWDGTTLPIIFTTSKLIKLLKIPVVTAVFKGSYFSHPRWSKYLQKGKITLDFQLFFTKDELNKNTAEHIHKKLTQALSFDEISYQEREKQIFKGKNPAEHMEQALFMCPHCSKIGSLYSKGNTLTCSACGYSVKYNCYRNFESETHSIIFSNIRDWNQWQIKEFYKFINDSGNNDNLLLNSSNLIVQTGYKEKRMKYLCKGAITLTRTSLLIRNNNGKLLRKFPVHEIIGVNVQNKEKLDFYAGGILYNIFDRKKRFSAYSWLIAIQYLQNNF